MRRLRRAVAPSRVLLFGNRAGAQHFTSCDIDLVIAFEAVPWRKRLHIVLVLWDGKVALERRCYTKREFAKHSKEISIVREAARTGVALKL